MTADVKYTVDECACLWGECRKRHFHLYDIYGNQEIDVSVCNEYIRLVFQEAISKLPRYKSLSDYDRNEIFRDVMIDVLPVRYLIHSDKTWRNYTEPIFFRRDNSPIANPRAITYKLIERPCLYFEVPIQRAWDLMYEHKGRGWALEYSFFRHYFFKYIESVFQHLLRYAKYKKQHERARWLLDKFRLSYGIDHEVMTETALLLLNLKILTHESTSKQ